MARGFVAHKRGTPQIAIPQETVIETEEELREFLRKEGIPVHVPENEKRVTTDA